MNSRPSESASGTINVSLHAYAWQYVVLKKNPKQPHSFSTTLIYI